MKNYILKLFIALIFSVMFSQNAYAQLNISIEWSADNTPIEMYLDDNGQHTRLKKLENKFTLENYSITGNLYTDMTIVSAHANYKISIPIRTYKNQANSINLFLAANSPKSCGYSVVKNLEHSASDTISWLSKLIEAQELSKRTGDAACSSKLKDRVTKVWFDASFNLADSVEQFRLDDAAYLELNRITDLSNHASLYKKRADVVYAKFLYQIMRRQFTQGNYQEAIKIGNSLIFDIQNNKFIDEYNKIPLQRLQKDVAWFESRSKS